MNGVKFIAVSNREPYIHRHSPEGVIECISPASGMTTAIDPILRSVGGIWVAHGSGDADRSAVDLNDHVAVPPGEPSYTLRRVWLDEELEKGYYYGLANEGLWPLCHVAFNRPVFRLSDWEAYRRANRIFAEAVLDEAAGNPAFVFIQDYHFGLLPRMLKNENPNLIVAQFWHIPWPNRETFRVFPWRDELLDGMLANDLLGFHLRYHCVNFLETVDRSVEAIVDTTHSNITRQGHVTMVRPFAISIDFEGHTRNAASIGVDTLMDRWIERIGFRPEFIGCGVDRVDYTKGIPDRLAAVDLFLDNHPEYVERFVFVQVGVPSRSNIGPYAYLAHEVDALVEQINGKWRRGGWQPIYYHRRHCSQPWLMALHRLSNFCLVSSLHDGMNLVAKEFVASRFDNRGVLILSQFAGAAHELADSLLVNPFSIDEMADAIARALAMPEEEQTRRMRRLREAVEENNIYRWAGKFLSTLLKIEVQERREGDEAGPVTSEVAAS